MDVFVMTVAFYLFLFATVIALWAAITWRFERKYSHVARKALHDGIVFSVIGIVAMAMLVCGASAVAALITMAVLAVTWLLWYRSVVTRSPKRGQW